MMSGIFHVRAPGKSAHIRLVHLCTLGLTEPSKAPKGKEKTAFKNLSE